MTQIKNMPHAVGVYLKGVGVESVELDANNHLIVHLDNGKAVDAGEFKVDDELNPNSSRPLANKALTSLFIAVNERINTLVGGNATEAIDNLNEIIAFLQNFKDSETLASTLVEINNAIAEVENDLQIKWGNKGYQYETMCFTEIGEYDVPSGLNYMPGLSYIVQDNRLYKLEGKISLSGGVYVEKINNKLVISGQNSFTPIHYVTVAKPILDILLPNTVLRKDDVLGDIIAGSSLPASADAISKELQKKVEKVEGKGLSTNDYTNEEKEQLANNTEDIATNAEKIAEQGAMLSKHGEDIAKNAEDIAKKANTTEYYPAMAVGVADNLRGRGEATEEEFTYRPSAGANNDIEGAGTATIKKIKGNSVFCEEEQSVINMSVESIKTVGFNLLDGNVARVIEGMTYVINNAESITLTPTNSTEVINVVLGEDNTYTAEASGTLNVVAVAGADACVHFQHSGYNNGVCEPYEEHILSLPIVAELFLDGMRSAGNIYDEIDFERQRYIVRIGEVDLGSLNWVTSAQSTYSNAFRAPLTGAVDNQVTSQYTLVPNSYFSASWLPNNLPNHINIYNGYIGINDPRYSDVASFKEAMKGVIINYALVEPIINPLPDNINNNYPVWDWGTEEAILKPNSAPFRANIVYGFNAVDTIRRNKLDIADILRRLAALEAKSATETINEE